MNLLSVVLSFPVREYNDDMEACAKDFVAKYGGRLVHRELNCVTLTYIKIGECYVDFNFPQRIFDSLEEYQEAIRKEKGIEFSQD